MLDGDWEWSDDNTVGMFLIRLLRKIRFQKQRKWHGFDLAANEFPASIDSLCTLTHMSKTTVKRCMECLMSSGDISEKVIPNKFRIIRIDPKWILSETDSKQLGQKCTNRDTNRSTNRDTNRSTNRSTNRGKKYPNRSANRSTPIKDNKKYSPPLREENTAHAPERPDGAGLGAKDGQIMSVEEIRAFGQTVPGSNDYLACDFRKGFLRSGTRVPPDWKEVYIRFAAAGNDKQSEFLDLLEKGAYREKWGCVD